MNTRLCQAIDQAFAGARAAMPLGDIPVAYRYQKDVLNRLPTHRASELENLLPHMWSPATGQAPSTGY